MIHACQPAHERGKGRRQWQQMIAVAHLWWQWSARLTNEEAGSV